MAAITHEEIESEEAFRVSARAWLRANLPDGWLAGPRREPRRLVDRFKFRHEWHRRLYRGGWMGLHWPKCCGGRGLSLVEQILFNEEAAAVEAPPIANWVGVELVGPTLIRWGSEEQQQNYLPRILSGDDIWCQAWSEPNAGSDLANVETTAVREGGDFLITGHKRWTSWAQFASHCVVLSRTGSSSLRHKSLSCFIVPLSQPGITICPIAMANREAEENDVYFSQVRVPAQNMLGPLDDGWRVVLTAMEHARGTATLFRAVELEGMLKRLLRSAKTARAGAGLADCRIRHRLTLLQTEIEALTCLAYRKLGELKKGLNTTATASVEKLIWSRLSQEITGLALQLEGLNALTGSSDNDEIWPGQWCDSLFRAKGTAIEGGTDEIQRNIIARRVLDLMV